MSRTLLLAALSVGALAAYGAAHAAAIPPAVAAAVADAGRPQADRDRDADRKPAEAVAFAGVKPGDKVIEIIPGGGYFTRILSKTVGAKGKVYVVVSVPSDPPKPVPVAAIAADPAYGNVVVEATGYQTIAAPEKADVVWTSQNYHDMHNMPIDMAKSDKSVFDALKPGGVFLILDHVAAAGAPADVTKTLHRIDPAVVRKEVEAVGFKFEGSSDVLKRGDDDHTKKAHEMHDHTDQFIYRFRKPK